MPTPITKALPHLVVTDDGHRPWHRRFRVIQLEDGRRIAFWWGGSRPLGFTNQISELLCKLEKKGDKPRFEKLGTEVSSIKLALGGFNWEYFEIPGAEPHTSGGCCYSDFVGIAFLPELPLCWKPTAVWPGWQHLAHGYEECESVWDRLEWSTAEELLTILEAEA